MDQEEESKEHYKDKEENLYCVSRWNIILLIPWDVGVLEVKKKSQSSLSNNAKSLGDTDSSIPGAKFKEI